MGTMNVYLGGAAKLAAALAEDGSLPALARPRAAPRSIPRRPLALIAALGTVLLAGLLAGLVGTDTLVRSTSACFVAVYVLALAAAVRILTGNARLVAATRWRSSRRRGRGFSSTFLLVPALVALAAVPLRRLSRRQRSAYPPAARRDQRRDRGADDRWRSEATRLGAPPPSGSRRSVVRSSAAAAPRRRLAAGSSVAPRRWSTWRVVCSKPKRSSSISSSSRRIAWQSSPGATSTCAESDGNPEPSSQTCRS